RAPGPAGGIGPAQRSFPPAQYRQCRDDRGRRRLASRARRAERPRPPAARRLAAARPHGGGPPPRSRVMTVYPIIIHLGPLEITGCGIMMMVAFLMGGWLAAVELRRRGFAEDYAADILVAAVIGGVVGAKIWYAVLVQDASVLLSRGGMV